MIISKETAAFVPRLGWSSEMLKSTKPNLSENVFIQEDSLFLKGNRVQALCNERQHFNDDKRSYILIVPHPL